MSQPTTPTPPSTAGAPPSGNDAAGAILDLDDQAFADALGIGAPEPDGGEAVTAPDAGSSAVADDLRSPETSTGEGEEEGEEPGEPEAPTAPEAPKPEAEKRPPLTVFKVLDAEGEVEVPEGIEIEFKANGKVRREPLDKVVLLASQGLYGSERLAKMNEVEARAADLDGRLQAVTAEAKTYEQHLERLLKDPEFYERAAQKYAETQTPEARAARAEQKVQEVERQAADRETTTVLRGFVEGTLIPKVEALLADHPQVTQAEVMDQFGRLVRPLLENGRLPATRLSDVQRIVEGDLTAYVRARHLETLDTSEKATTAKAAPKAAPAKVTPERRELAKTKRTLARAVAPRPAAETAPPAKPTVYESAEDWFKETFKEE